VILTGSGRSSFSFFSFLFLPLDLSASKLCHLAYTKPHKRTRLTD
jgi:hypothetical protein